MLQTRSPDQDPTGRDRQSTVPGVDAHYARARQRVQSDSVQRWQHRLSNTEVEMIEAICERGMKEAGYNFQSPPSKRARFRRLKHSHLLQLRAAQAELALRRGLGPLARAIGRMADRARH